MTSSDSHATRPLLIGRHRDAPVAGFARMDRDQVFLLCEPVVHVYEEIRVALNAGRRVGREVGVADDDDAHLRLRRRGRRFAGLVPLRVGRCSAAAGGASGASIENDSAIVIGPLLIARRLIQRDLAAGGEGFGVGLRPASLARLDQVLSVRGREAVPASPRPTATAETR